ncbi:MAG: diguanylate cyclase [Myxococcales bacterium]
MSFGLRARLAWGVLVVLGWPWTASAETLERVTLQLKWRHQFQFAGYYAAAEKGYYRQAGLEVALVEARADRDPVQSVLGGGASFGVATSELALLRARGEPVVLLAVIFQHSPLALYARQGSDLRQTSDLAGKKILIEAQSAELLAYLASQGVERNTFQSVEHDFFDVNELLSGAVDAMSGYSTDEPFALRQAGFAFHSFSPRSVGIDFYGDCLFTTEDEVNHHADRARRFRDASLRGWNYALDHPEEIVDLIMTRYGTRKSREHLLFEASEMRPLIRAELMEIGYANPERWRSITEVYAKLGFVPHGVRLDRFFYAPPARKLGWFYAMAGGGLLAAIAAAVVATYVGRLNRSLRTEMARTAQSQAVLRMAEGRFRVMVDVAPFPLVLTRLADHTVFYINHWASALFGMPQQEALGKQVIEYWTDASNRSAFLGELQDKGFVHDVEVDLLRSTGERFTALLSAVQMQDGDEDLLVTAVVDITARRQIEKRLRESEELHRSIVTASPDPIVITDERGIIRKISPATQTLLGYKEHEAVGRSPLDFVVPEDTERATLHMARLLEGEATGPAEYGIRRREGDIAIGEANAELVHDVTGAPMGIVVVVRDVTERRQAQMALERANVRLQEQLTAIERLQADLHEQAVRDALTGLHNRRYLDETLEREIARAARGNYDVGVLLIDVDHFKRFNDVHGHRAGDLVLEALGKYLRTQVRAGDIACRYGGEEFVVVFPGVPEDSVAGRADELRKGFAELRVAHGDVELQATLSIGAALYPTHGQTADAVLDAADGALYEAKAQGRNRVVRASTSMRRGSSPLGWHAMEEDAVSVVGLR